MQSFTTYLQVGGGVAKVSTVKSVQRGTGQLKNVGSSTNINVITTSFPIKPVNPDKTIILLNGTPIKYTQENNLYVVSLTENEFTVGLSYGQNESTGMTSTGVIGTFSWQVIEFY